MSSDKFDEHSIRYLLNCDQTFSWKILEMIYRTKDDFGEADFILMGFLTSRRPDQSSFKQH